MKNTRLMIVMGEKAWTQAALHLACAMSRRSQVELLLLQMVPVKNPVLLGTTAGSLNLTPEDALGLAEMTATAEDYGVVLVAHQCQYANYWPAVVDAAMQLEATAVIVKMPSALFSPWQMLCRRLLHRRLARQGQLLITLDDLAPSLTWVPSITLQDDMTSKLLHHHAHLQ